MPPPKPAEATPPVMVSPCSVEVPLIIRMTRESPLASSVMSALPSPLTSPSMVTLLVISSSVPPSVMTPSLTPAVLPPVIDAAKLIVSAPEPAGASPAAASVLAACSASRSDILPSTAMVSSSVETMKVVIPALSCRLCGDVFTHSHSAASGAIACAGSGKRRAAPRAQAGVAGRGQHGACSCGLTPQRPSLTESESRGLLALQFMY